MALDNGALAVIGILATALIGAVGWFLNYHHKKVERMEGMVAELQQNLAVLKPVQDLIIQHGTQVIDQIVAKGAKK